MNIVENETLSRFFRATSKFSTEINTETYLFAITHHHHVTTEINFEAKMYFLLTKPFTELAVTEACRYLQIVDVCMPSSVFVSVHFNAESIPG